MNENTSVGLIHYARVLLSRWKLIVATILLFVAGGAVYMQIATGLWTASTIVNVNVIVSDPFNPSRAASSLVDASTEDQVASSYVVAEMARDKLQSNITASELQRRVTTEIGPDATTVKVSFSASTASKARAGADAVANAYLAYRQEQAEERKQRMIDELEPRLEGLSSDGTGSTQERALALQTQISQLASIDTDGGTVLTPATKNAVTFSPRPLMVMLTSGCAGLAAGVLLAFAAHNMDGRVRTVRDVATAGAGPVLAVLRSRNFTMPASGDDRHMFQMLRERLLAQGDPPDVLAVIDISGRTGFSDVPINLAVALAQNENRIELILPGGERLGDELLKSNLNLRPSGQDGDGDSFVSDGIEGLSIYLPRVAAPGTGPDEFVTESVRHLVTRPTDGGKRILVLPAHAPLASRLAAMRLSDGVIAVVGKLATRHRVLAATSRRSHTMGTTLLGSVIVDRRPHIPDAADKSQEPTIARHLDELVERPSRSSV